MLTLDELIVSPYPWHFELRKDKILLCSREGLGIVVTTHTGDGDARLIASAPMLYEALAAMLHCAELNKPYLDMSHMDIAMDMARKALVAASGESEVAK